MYSSPIMIPDSKSGLDLTLQTWIEGGIVYGQLWDYLQRELGRLNMAMEIRDDANGVNYYSIEKKPYAVEYNSEIEMVIAAIETLIEHKVSP